MRSDLPPPRVTRRPHEIAVEQEVNGETVSGLVVNDLAVRVGVARLRMGGVGGVWTKKEHRRRGYSARCMAEAVEAMKREGFAVAMLFGIPDFYHRWGFAGAMAEPRCVVPTAQAALAPGVPDLRAAPYDPVRHRAACVRLDEAARLPRSGSLVRQLGWPLFRVGAWWGRKTKAFVLLDRRRHVAGYAAFDEPREFMNVVETGARDRRVLPVVMAELAREARTRRAEAITCHLPPDHEFVEYARQYEVTTSAAFYPNGQGMGRIIDLQATLRACAPEFTRRLQRSGLARQRVRLTIKTDIGSAMLRWAEPRCSVEADRAGGIAMRVPQAVLFQLLIGYRSVDDAAASPGVVIPRSALEPMRALFPAGYPYLWCTDRF